MNRENKREVERQRMRNEDTREPRAAHPPASTAPSGGRRTAPRQFLREVRQELKRVNWPSRREVASYSLVVLVSVSILTLFIFGLDQAFGQFVLWIFG